MIRLIVPGRIVFTAVALSAAVATARAQEVVTRTVDSTLTQKWTSDFGFSFLLPPKAKPNPIGSSLNLGGQTQTANFILSGGSGAIKIWNYRETQVVPAGYKLLDSVVFVDADSSGVNGKIRTRTYIMDSIVVRVEVLLTPKGEGEYAEKVRAIFDSFIPPVNARRQLAQWRYDYGKMHNGGKRDDWQRGPNK